MIVVRMIAIAVVAMLVGAGTPADVSAQQLEKQELKCAKKMPGTALKLASTIIKETTKCLDSDISGKVIGACPNAGNATKITKGQDKLLSDIGKNCTSTCSVSGTPCISDVSCPPLSGGGRESCNAGAKLVPMDIRNLGFPGSLCPLTIGGGVTTPGDVNACVSALTQNVADGYLASVYGSITNASGLTGTAPKCLSSISKAASKLGVSTLKAVNKCRATLAKTKFLCVAGDNDGKVCKQDEDCPLGACLRPATIAADNCLTADQRTLDTVAKAEAKLAKAIDKKCTDADIGFLDLCGNGIGGTANRAEATTCVTEQARQLFAATTLSYDQRSVSVPSLEEAVYPPIARCGDGLINGLQGAFNQYPEECDGDDNDAACDGACLPPGDAFECMCGDVLRTLFISDATQSELDSGWTGNSHDSTVNDGGGFVSMMSNCDCTDMDNAECIGVTGDPVCDTTGYQKPRCNWDHDGALGCDEHGDGDGVARDSDCFICDAESSNAGTLCDEDGDCTSQCFDAGGTPTGACSQQSDCAAGETCLGKCDFDATCQIILLSHPTPTSASGNPTCLLTQFREDIYGTSNILTGERETFIELRTYVFSGPSVPQPCPVCGGLCVGGTQEGEICEGSCSVSGDPCRFDTDCPVSETCTDASIDCPGGACELELRCFGGAKDGEACRIGSFTPLFGSTSADCPSDDGANISGDGLEIPFLPSSSEFQSISYDSPCTSPGFELYDCACNALPGDPVGTATKPNTCRPACDAGTELGTGCATGTGTGQFTLCVGGTNNAKGCDEDLDCPGGTCSGNPTHCVGTGNPLTELDSCSSNVDCGAGTCVDACPSGRCVPLCLADPSDDQDGLCAAGPIEYRCNGVKDTFRTCTAAAQAGGCSATCSTAGTPCFGDADCPGGESCLGSCLKAQDCEAGVDGNLGTPDDITGAGTCEIDTRRCFLNPIIAEGGDTLNGEGSPNEANSPSLYCVAATTSLLVNAATGLPGPGRLRSRGVIISNGVSSLP